GRTGGAVGDRAGEESGDVDLRQHARPGGTIVLGAAAPTPAVGRADRGTSLGAGSGAAAAHRTPLQQRPTAGGGGQSQPGTWGRCRRRRWRGARASPGRGGAAAAARGPQWPRAGTGAVRPGADGVGGRPVGGGGDGRRRPVRAV